MSSPDRIHSMEASKHTSDSLYSRILFPKIKETIQSFLAQILEQAIEINELSVSEVDAETQIAQLRKLSAEDVDQEGLAGFLELLKEFFSKVMFLCESNNSFSEYLKKIAAFLYLDYASRSVEANLMEQLAHILPFETDDASVDSTAASASLEETLDSHVSIGDDVSSLRVFVSGHSIL